MGLVEARRRHLSASPSSLVRSADIGDHTLTLMLDRISVDPNVCDGKPSIRGLRITVDFILKLLGDAYTAD